ncbi:MAG: hypothetical protein J1E61_08190 [Lachnospiraceae bacterium]|nr:hypothetical protein [Lachnospiraceae bacterium]
MPTVNGLDEFLDLGSHMTQVTKAKIKVIDRNGDKAGEDIEVLFNPSEYTLSEASEYTVRRRSSADAPSMMYTGGKATTLSMELFFYTGPMIYASGKSEVAATDVSKKIKEFEELVYINGELHSPPIVKFIWGSLSFKGVVTELQSTFMKFTETGMPIQAKVKLSLTAYYEVSEKKRISPFESPDRTKCRMVREDYSIWDMAQKEYGDVSKWKIIASANNISNPLDVPPGTVVKIPAL